VKILTALLVAVTVLFGTWLYAQKAPPPRRNPRPVNTNAETRPTPALTPEQTDAMVQTLRRAMTNPPVVPTAAPVIQTNPPVRVTTPPVTVVNPNTGVLSAPSQLTNAVPTAPPSTQITAPPVVVVPPAVVVPTNAASPAAATPQALPNTVPVPANPTPPTIVAPNVPAAVAPGQLVPTQNVPSAAVQGQPAPIQAVPAQVTPGPGPNLPGVPAAAVQQPPAAAPPAVADPNQIIPATVIQVQGMPLDQFFEIYSMVSGRTVLRPYALAGAPQGITLKAQTDWTRQEAVFAMDAVLALNQIAMIPVDEKFVKAVPAQIAPTEGGPLSQMKSKEYSEAEQFVTQIVELKTVKPTELAQVLTSFSKIPNSITPFDHNNTIVLREYTSNVKRMLEVIEKVDVERPSEYKLEVIPIKYGKVEDLYDTMSSLISGQGGTAGGGAASAAATGARATGGRQTGGRLGRSSGSSRLGQSGYGGYGYGGGYGRGMGTYSPQQAQPTAGGAQANFQNRLQQIVQRAAGGPQMELLEDAKIVPDYRSNKLLIFANKKDMEMITNIVAKVDVLLAQVLIEAIIMEVQLGDTQNLGVSMLQNPRRFGGNLTGAGVLNNGQSFLNNITNFPGAAPSGFNYFGKINDDMEFAVRAIATDSTINVISRPRIQTSHAIPGNFDFITVVPYPSGSYDSYGYGGFGGIGGGYTPRTIVERVEVGIRLEVTPFITPEGLVVMEIYQEASQVGRDRIIDNNPIPEISERSAEATLTVRNKDTILMGGFITSSKTKRKSGVPLLKDIPGVGALFRSKDTDNSRSELIILMRATVLESPEEAAIVAKEEKAGLIGIQEAEKQFQQDEHKRRKKPKSSKP